MDAYTALWIIWLALFGAIEGAALANKREGDTLSEHVWRVCAIRDKGRGWRLRRLALLAFLAWMVMHFISGGEF